MKNYKEQFPLLKTKVEGVDKKYDLSNPEERQEYFRKKAGAEIKALNQYFKNNSFIAYLLGKKNSGKGTYAKLMMEIFGQDQIDHISIGDIVRAAHEDMENKEKKQEVIDYLANNYRGYISVDDAINSLLSRDTKSLLPTEFILTLVKKEIDKLGRRSLLIDGFPRDLDQVSYSLYFRDLINYREDTDIFIGIDIPEVVIDERMKNRVICPECHTPRNLKLLATKEVGYDEDKQEFFLKCDNEKCGGARMVGKEGDELGIEAIRKRLELDGQLIDKVFALHGIPKILLRNAIPVEFAKANIDDYEITPAYFYEYDKKKKEVEVQEKPWVIKDDDGQEALSLLPAPVVVTLIKQLAKVLGL